MGKRNRRNQKNRRKTNPYGSPGQAHDAPSAATTGAAAPAPDSPSGAASSPAESNPYGSSMGYETPDDVRAAGLSPDLPYEAPDPDDDIEYSDGETFFEKFPELLRGADASPGA